MTLCQISFKVEENDGWTNILVVQATVVWEPACPEYIRYVEVCWLYWEYRGGSPIAVQCPI